MRIVSNTSPLVFLAKLGKLEFLDKHEMLVPSDVVGELKIWERTGKETYALLLNWLSKANVTIKKVEKLQNLPKNLHEGEKAAISLAIHENVKTVLIDERKARAAAKSNGLKVFGTMAIIKQQLKDNKISVKECRQIVLELVKKGYRIKEELLAEFLQHLEASESEK